MIKELLKNIRAARKAKGIKQESIAYHLGIDYSTYGKIERGQISLTVDRMEKIAAYLKVHVSEIYPYAKPDLSFIKSQFLLCKNEPLGRFEFTSTGGKCGYLVSFFEVDENEELAWQAVEKSFNRTKL